MNYAQKIIRAFGGVRALARMMERPASTVGSWGDRGSIPDEEKARILALSEVHGVGLGPADFFPVELIPAPRPSLESPTPDAEDAA